MEDYIYRCTSCGKLTRLTSISGDRPEAGSDVHYYCPYCKGTLSQGKSVMSYIPDIRCFISSDYGDIEFYRTDEEDGAMCVAMRSEQTDGEQVDIFLHRDEAMEVARFILESFGGGTDV